MTGLEWTLNGYTLSFVPAMWLAAAGVLAADLIARDIFSPYLADVLDLDKHARHGRQLVVEAEGQIRGFGAFYPDVSVQGFGWPPGWAGGRALAVHPDARGHGVARALLAACERLARDCGAPVFGFHTASFMTGAIALYERLGYRRAPEFDFDMAARYSRFGAAPIMSIAYLRLAGAGARRVRVISLSGGSDDHQRSYPAGQFARLLPGPSGGPLAGRVRAAAGGAAGGPLVVHQRGAWPGCARRMR